MSKHNQHVTGKHNERNNENLLACLVAWLVDSLAIRLVLLDDCRFQLVIVIPLFVGRVVSPNL